MESVRQWIDSVASELRWAETFMSFETFKANMILMQSILKDAIAFGLKISAYVAAEYIKTLH